MNIDSDYTLLPFLNPLTCAKLLGTVFIIMIAAFIVKAVVFKKSLTLHAAPTSICFAYITTSIINILLCTFLYWYWALPVSLLMSCIFAFVTWGDVKDANTEERIGVWGLNRDIKQIRGELYNDMTIEEQLEYSKNVKPAKFNWIVFIIVTLLAAVVFISVCHFLDIGYLFKPVLIEQ